MYEHLDIETDVLCPLCPRHVWGFNNSLVQLPDGNILICEATQGRLFEVTRDKEIVWEYHSPFLVSRPDYWGWTLAKTIWDAQRYAPDYPAFEGKDLDPDRYEFVLRRRDEQDLRQEAALKRLKSLGY